MVLDHNKCLDNLDKCDTNLLYMNTACPNVCNDRAKAEAELEALKSIPYCPVDDAYCNSILSGVLSKQFPHKSYQLLSSSTVDRVCILKENTTGESYQLKIANDCEATLLPLHPTPAPTSCIVSDEFCKQLSTQAPLSGYRYDSFSSSSNLCIYRSNTNQQPYKVTVSQDCQKIMFHHDKPYFG
jgi:hypothetical protein